MIGSHGIYLLTSRDLPILFFCYTSLGFGLEEITRIISAAENGNVDVMKNMFMKHLERNRHEIDRLEKIEQILLQKHQKLEMFYLRSTEPVMKEIPRLRILSIREVGDFNIFPRLIDTLFKEISNKDNQRNFVHLNYHCLKLGHSSCTDGGHRSNKSAKVLISNGFHVATMLSNLPAASRFNLHVFS
ncbi:hypothetical protein GF325_07270, partial [Candidatus Bathyarchaeota archaeon]|nr:hypothetical protein [Candidatus Bathyarchaeota archaeon]